MAGEKRAVYDRCSTSLKKRVCGEDRFVSSRSSVEMNFNVMLVRGGGEGLRSALRGACNFRYRFDDVVTSSPLAIVVDYVTLMTRWS